MGGATSKEDFDDGATSEVESGGAEVLSAEEEIQRVLRRALGPARDNAPNSIYFFFSPFFLLLSELNA